VINELPGSRLFGFIALLLGGRQQNRHECSLRGRLTFCVPDSKYSSCHASLICACVVSSLSRLRLAAALHWELLSRRHCAGGADSAHWSVTAAAAAAAVSAGCCAN